VPGTSRYASRSRRWSSSSCARSSGRRRGGTARQRRCNIYIGTIRATVTCSPPCDARPPRGRSAGSSSRYRGC
jgi:hypothetical protein